MTFSFGFKVTHSDLAQAVRQQLSASFSGIEKRPACIKHPPGKCWKGRLAATSHIVYEFILKQGSLPCL